MAKKKGFIARMIEGPERSETYARSTMPGNRWELGWGIVRDNFGKLFGLNMLMLLFFIPVIMLVLWRYIQVQYYATVIPFSGNIGLGYPAIANMAGFTEQIYYMVDRSVFMLMPVAGIVASIGIAGGMYVMRNMVWAEGVFVGKDFWSGVKKNFVNVLLSTLVYTVILFLGIVSIRTGNYINAVQGSKWFISLAVVIGYIMLTYFTIVYLYMLTFGVTYKLKFFHLLKNSCIMAIGLLPTNLFFAAFAFVSVLLMVIGGMFMMLGVMIFIIFGFSGAALIWTDYSQWTFDKFINDNVPGAVKNRGIYSKKPEDEESDFSFERSTLGKRPVKPVTDYDVEIAELPQNFSRADLQRLEESKAAMRKDSDEYVKDVLSGKIKPEKTDEESAADGTPETEGDSSDTSDSSDATGIGGESIPATDSETADNSAEEKNDEEDK